MEGYFFLLLVFHRVLLISGNIGFVKEVNYGETHNIKRRKKSIHFLHLIVSRYHVRIIWRRNTGNEDEKK